ncbi:MAG: hypothetical protein H0W48_02165 [Methylibium sp.]|nr:hypothetical protein [Methylibium sp.]
MKHLGSIPSDLRGLDGGLVSLSDRKSSRKRIRMLNRSKVALSALLALAAGAQAQTPWDAMRRVLEDGAVAGD